MNETVIAEEPIEKVSIRDGHSLRAVPCAIAVLCLLLPFFKISWALAPAMNQSVPGWKLIVWNRIGEPPAEVKTQPNKWAITFVVLTLVGVAFSQKQGRNRFIMSAFASIGGIAALIALWMNAQEEIQATGGVLVIKPEVGFHAAWVLLALSAILHTYLWQTQIENKEVSTTSELETGAKKSGTNWSWFDD